MPTTVIELQNAQPDVLPDPAFVETSFLRDAVRWARLQEGGPRTRTASDFVRTLRRSDVDLWTTTAVIEETLFGFLKTAIRAAAPQDATGRPLSWGDFKRHRPEAFGRAFRAHAPVIATGLRRFLRTEGIAMRLPRATGREERAGAVLYGMTRLLLRRHVIEPADAMHYASAWIDGTCAFLSNDRGFQEIDGAEIYTSL